MFKAKAILFLSIFLIISYCMAQPQLFSLPQPQKTVLIDKSSQEKEYGEATVYHYQSQMPKEQIVNFYKAALRRQGLEEIDAIGKIDPKWESKKDCEDGKCGQKISNESTAAKVESLRTYLQEQLKEQNKRREILQNKLKQDGIGKRIFFFQDKNKKNMAQLIFHNPSQEETAFFIIVYRKNVEKDK